MKAKSITIAGKPLSRFYQLPFEKGSRVLSLAVLEQIASDPIVIGLYSAFSVGKNPEPLVIASLSFEQGFLTVHVKLEGEEARVYIAVEYDCLAGEL